MRWRTRQTWLAAALSVGLAAGCERAAVRPSDPLLLSHKPIESKPELTGPVLVARVEVDAPGPPAIALATAPVELDPAGKTRLASRSRSLPPITTAVRSPTSGTPTTLAGRRRVAGTFGHATDYSWLQGVVEQVSSHGYLLRYVAADEHDALGGQVWLEEDSRLARFRPGDVVHVEGEVIRDAGSTLRETRGWPRYRIRHVQPVPPAS